MKEADNRFTKLTKRLVLGSVVVVGAAVFAGRLRNGGNVITLAQPSESGRYELDFYDPDTDVSVRLAREATLGTFSPDGERIAYIDYSGSKANLEIRHLKIGSIVNVAHGTFTGEPSWSPDGEKLVFSVTEDVANPYHMLVKDFKENTVKDLGEGEDPLWSPDGKKIVFTQVNIYQSPPSPTNSIRTTNVSIMDADGTNKKRILPVEYQTGYPSWSPDGKKLALAGKQNGATNIFIVDAYNPDTFYNLTNRSDYNSFPSWSTDGKKIAFIGNRNPYLNLYVYDLETDSVSQLTHDIVLLTAASWSPDQSKLAVGFFDRQGNFVLFVDLMTGNVKAVGTKSLREHAWRPES